MLLAFLGTFGYCILGAVIPFLNTEIYLLAVSAAAPRSLILPLIIAAALGQMVGKSAMYFAGRGAMRLPSERLRRMVESVRLRYQTGSAAPALGGTVLMASATVGLPPFYIVAVACGIFRVPFLQFLLIGLTGMLIRYGVVVMAPQLLKGLSG